MSAKTIRIFAVIPILIFCEFIAGCGISPDEQAVTSTALTAAASTYTPIPTQISLATDTPTPAPEPTTTPSSIAKFEDMEGIWSRNYRGAEFQLTINKDGRVTHVEVYFPQDVRIPDIWFEDGFLYIRETTSTCSRDQVGIYEITGAPGEYLSSHPSTIHAEFIGISEESGLKCPLSRPQLSHS